MNKFFTVLAGLLIASSMMAIESDKTDNTFSSKVSTFGAAMEIGIRKGKTWPQYQYIARPIYKALGGPTCPLISVPLTFMATDILCHGLPLELMYFSIHRAFWSDYGIKKHLKNMNWPVHISRNIIWTSLGIPVAYVKYKRSRQSDLP